MADPIAYTRLPGIGNRFADATVVYGHRAYLGPDHVLLVRRSRYGETYRRLYLDDIQAVFYAETDNARTFTIGALVGCLSVASLTIVFAQSPIGASAAGASIGLAGTIALLVVLAANVFRGASARCWIRTKGGESLVPNVGRLRAARRFAQAIEDAVSMRQGAAEHDRVKTHLSALHVPLAGESAVTANRPKSDRGLWLFLFVEAAYAGLTMAMPGTFPPGLWILITVVVGAVALMVLFRGSGKHWHSPYRALVTATGYYVTARSLYWALYWFMLTMEGTFIFEIAQQDLLKLGGLTIFGNIILGGLGFIIPASHPKRQTPVVVPDSMPPSDGES